jgi:hydrophobic/amphiphilic exporter-1 (mainly G- bacteria), HAE1 family
VRLTEFSLKNPLVVTALAMALLCFGVYSYSAMGISVFPNVSFPGANITTVVPGADAATVETQVTKPIEDAIATLPNIDLMYSQSMEGVSVVSVNFTPAANSALIGVDVERVVNAIRSRLPADAESPSVQKVDTSAFPVLRIGLFGPQPIDQLQEIAKDRVQSTLEALPGVGSVTVSGGRVREIQVRADLDKLQAHGLGLNSLQQALQSEQFEMPAGAITASGRNVNVRLTAMATQPEQLGRIIVAQTPQGPVYVRDVATVDDTLKKPTTINRVNGIPAVTFVVTKLAAANTLEVSRAVRQAMVDVQPSLPEGMHMDVIADEATYARLSFTTIQKTLLEAVFLTGLILLLFLHTWRSTLIVLVSIPTSVLTTLAMMNFLGMNLNLFSMLALTLSVGILVDDSIVVLENIYRHLGMRKAPFIAALHGRNEIGLAAITITMVDVVVYIPIAMMKDLSGEFIRPFALVITAATLTSLLISFTVTPLLASRYLRREHALKQGNNPLDRFGRRWDAGFEHVGEVYSRVLTRILTGKVLRVISGRWAVIALGFVSFVLGIGLLSTGRIGFDIFPSGDQGEVDVTLLMPAATNIDRTYEVAQLLEARIHAYPEVNKVYTNTGNLGVSLFGTTGGDTSRIAAFLVPRGERTRSSAEVAEDMRLNLGRGIPGADVRVALPNAFGFGGFGQQPIQVAVRGPNSEVLNPIVEKVTAIIRSTPGATAVNNENERLQREYLIRIDHERSADLGVSAAQAASALRTAVSGTVVGKYRRPGQNDVDIRLVAAESYTAGTDKLAVLPLLSNKGTIVALGQLGQITTTGAPTSIQHVNRERSVIVGASGGGRLVGDIQRDIEAQINQQIVLPPGYSITYYGQTTQGGQAFGNIFRAMGIALVLMYLLMMMLFSSVTLPLSVLMSLPLAVVGSLGAMAITETAFTLFSLLGFSLLIGLVGKNAILLVDFTDRLRRQGMGRVEALATAGPIRLRPILMTTLAVVVALSPLAFGVEEGSELLKAAAVVLSGGLITSTLLTLVFIPAMYTIFDDIEQLVVRLVRRVSEPRQLDLDELQFLGRPVPTIGQATPAHLEAPEPLAPLDPPLPTLTPIPEESAEDSAPVPATTP